MLFRKKITPVSYDKERLRPEIHRSICTGERTAGFYDREKGKYEEQLLIRSEKDIARFCAQYGIERNEIKEVY